MSRSGVESVQLMVFFVAEVLRILGIAVMPQFNESGWAPPRLVTTQAARVGLVRLHDPRELYTHGSFFVS